MVRKGRIGDYVTKKSLYVDVTEGTQPDYTRGPSTHATAKKLTAFRTCVAEKLAGKSYKGAENPRKAARDAFAAAAKACKV